MAALWLIRVLLFALVTFVDGGSYCGGLGGRVYCKFGCCNDSESDGCCIHHIYPKEHSLSPHAIYILIAIGVIFLKVLIWVLVCRCRRRRGHVIIIERATATQRTTGAITTNPAHAGYDQQSSGYVQQLPKVI